MGVLSIHPIEYLKLYLHSDHAKGRIHILSSVGPRLEKIFHLAEKGSSIGIVVLTASMVIFALMKLGESRILMASYCDGCGLFSMKFMAPW